MSDLDRLVGLTPPQDTATSALDWAAVEAALALSLPDDYKALVQRYGSGAFDDFIWLLSPGASEHLDLLRQRRARLDALQVLRDDGEAMRTTSLPCFPGPSPTTATSCTGSSTRS
jgi:hypothetical protein